MISMNTISAKLRETNKYIFIYYILILCATIAVSKPNANLGNIYRFGYLCLVLLPLSFNVRIAPLVLTTFIGISFASFAPLLPTNTTYYFIIVSIPLIARKPKSTTKVLLFVLLFVLYYLCIELFNGTPRTNFIKWIFITFLLFQSIISKEDLNLFAKSFPVISLVLSILFFLNFDSFVEEVAIMGEEVERSGWINPNIFGAYVGCGLVMAFYYFLNDRTNSKPIKIFYLSTIIFSIITLIMNASRGVVLSCSVSIVFILLFSNVKKFYKISIPILLVLFLVTLYSLGTFDLLEARFATENTATAGGRTDIWLAKLNEFKNLPFGQQVFGVGYNNCVALGGNDMDTHNDLFTALFAYGYVGLLLFSVMLILPLYLSRKNNFFIVLGFEVFLIMECFVLSPIFRGYFLFIAFYFFILKYALFSKTEFQSSMQY